MRFDDVLDDFYAQACPAGFHADGPCGGQERLADFWRHAPAGVCDRQENIVSSGFDAPRHRDGSAAGHFRNRIVDKVVNGVKQATFVGQNGRNRRVFMDP